MSEKFGEPNYCEFLYVVQNINNLEECFLDF